MNPVDVQEAVKWTSTLRRPRISSTNSSPSLAPIMGMWLSSWPDGEPAPGRVGIALRQRLTEPGVTVMEAG